MELEKLCREIWRCNDENLAKGEAIYEAIENDEMCIPQLVAALRLALNRSHSIELVYSEVKRRLDLDIIEIRAEHQAKKIQDAIDKTWKGHENDKKVEFVDDII